MTPRSMPACVKMNEVRLAAVNRCLSCFLPAHLLGPHVIFKYLKGRPFLPVSHTSPFMNPPTAFLAPRHRSVRRRRWRRRWWARTCCSAKDSGSSCSVPRNNSHARSLSAQLLGSKTPQRKRVRCAFTKVDLRSADSLSLFWYVKLA